MTIGRPVQVLSHPGAMLECTQLSARSGGPLASLRAQRRRERHLSSLDARAAGGGSARRARLRARRVPGVVGADAHLVGGSGEVRPALVDDDGPLVLAAHPCSFRHATAPPSPPVSKESKRLLSLETGVWKRMDTAGGWAGSRDTVDPWNLGHLSPLLLQLRLQRAQTRSCATQRGDL